MTEYITTKIPLSIARCNNHGYFSSITDFETEYINKYYRIYSTDVYLIFSTIKHKRSLYEVNREERTEEHLKQWFYPVINALSSLHEHGLCHTSVKSANIFEIDKGSYILSDVCKHYFYGNQYLKEHGFNIPEELIERKTPCFEYKEDNRMLGEVLEEYIKDSKIENKEDYEGIIRELKESDNDLDLIKLLNKYTSVFPKPEISIETILRKEYYKLTYFKYPMIDISIEEYLKILRSEKDEEMKYRLSVCLLNSISMNEGKRTEVSDDEFMGLKEIFYKEIQRENKKELKELRNPIKREIFEEVLKDRNTEEINLKKSIIFDNIYNILIEMPTLSKYECVLFSIILSCFNNIRVFNLGRNYIGMINTKHIIEGIQHHKQLKELTLSSMLFNYNSLEMLCNVLKNNPNLEVLNLKITRTFYVNLYPIKKMVEGMKMVLNNCSNLKFLNIKNNCVSTSDISYGILDGIKRMTKLTTLKLNCINYIYRIIANNFDVIDEYDYERVYDEIEEENGKVLNEENIKNRNLIINTGKIVNSIIERLTNLKILKLNSIIFISSIFVDCRIADNIMIEICESLNNLHELEQLNLEGNELTEKSMYELGESISKMRELKSLNMSSIYNIYFYIFCYLNYHINDYGIFLLFHSFENEIISPKLNEIMINKNQISCEGFYHFLFLIRNHKSITKLNINLVCDLVNNNKNDITQFKESMNYMKEINNLKELNMSWIKI